MLTKLPSLRDKILAGVKAEKREVKKKIRIKKPQKVVVKRIKKNQ